MNLTTQWLGLELKNPFVPSASPLSRSLDAAKQLEDAGAAAIVMYSLFEEEIEAEELRAQHLEHHQDIGHAEASSFLPVHGEYPSCRDDYLEQLLRLKEALDIPVIASLNGISNGGWTNYAKLIESAGADALDADAIDRLAERAMTTFDVPGMAIGVLKDGAVVYAKGHGVRELVSHVVRGVSQLLLGAVDQVIDAGFKHRIGDGCAFNGCGGAGGE